ncbi:hypothetical protein J6590_020999 [Homalodisca vitripennis]|nr:hypothetical protein J6590_020999 [Homalodisca vitripennis]
MHSNGPATTALTDRLTRSSPILNTLLQPRSVQFRSSVAVNKGLLKVDCSHSLDAQFVSISVTVVSNLPQCLIRLADSEEEEDSPQLETIATREQQQRQSLCRLDRINQRHAYTASYINYNSLPRRVRAVNFEEDYFNLGHSREGVLFSGVGSGRRPGSPLSRGPVYSGSRMVASTTESGLCPRQLPSPNHLPKAARARGGVRRDRGAINLPDLTQQRPA